MGRSERHIDTGIQSDYVLMSSNIYHCYCNTTDIALSWCHFGSWFQSVCTCTWFKTGASFKTPGIFFGSSSSANFGYFGIFSVHYLLLVYFCLLVLFWMLQVILSFKYCHNNSPQKPAVFSLSILVFLLLIIYWFWCSLVLNWFL